MKNYMGEFLSDESKEIIERIKEKYRLKEIEDRKPKPRKKKKR